MFCMLGGAGRSIQLGLEVPVRPRREAGRWPRCVMVQRWPGAGALRGEQHHGAVAGWWRGAHCREGRSNAGGDTAGWEDGASTGGPAQGGGGNGKASLPSLGLQLLGSILAWFVPCLEIKSWTDVLRVFLN